jgi:hypothetical protein
MSSWIDPRRTSGRPFSYIESTANFYEVYKWYLSEEFMGYPSEIQLLLKQTNSWSASPKERLAAVKEIKKAYLNNEFERSTFLQGRIDLHSHTIYSDGQYTPSFLVTFYWLYGLSAFAITDHNTFDGIHEAIYASKELEINFIPGIEISVFEEVSDYKKLHVTAYWQGSNSQFIRWVKQSRSEELLQTIEIVTQREKQRMVSVRTVFNEQFPALALTNEDVQSLFPFGAAKRTDLARVLYNKHGPEGSRLLPEASVKDIKKMYFKDSVIYNGTIKRHLSLAAISKFCIQHNFALAWAHPLHHQKWKKNEIIDVMQKYFLGFRAVEFLHPSIKQKEIGELEEVIDTLNNGTYRSQPLIKTIGLDIHSNVERRFGILTPTRSFEGLLAYRTSIEAAQFIPRNYRHRYFADCLLAWARLSLVDQLATGIYPVCATQDFELGERNRNGQIVTVSPAVVRILCDKYKDNYEFEKKLIFSCIKPQLHISQNFEYSPLFIALQSSPRKIVAPYINNTQPIMEQAIKKRLSSGTFSFLLSLNEQKNAQLLSSITQQRSREELRGLLHAHRGSNPSRSTSDTIQIFKQAHYARLELAHYFDFIKKKEMIKEKTNVDMVIEGFRNAAENSNVYLRSA